MFIYNICMHNFTVYEHYNKKYISIAFLFSVTIYKQNYHCMIVNLLTLKGVFAKNERGYRLTAKNNRF